MFLRIKEMSSFSIVATHIECLQALEKDSGRDGPSLIPLFDFRRTSTKFWDVFDIGKYASVSCDLIEMTVVHLFEFVDFPKIMFFCLKGQVINKRRYLRMFV